MTTGLRERKKALTRSTIVMSAWSLFQQRGVAETSIRDIAELADVAEKTVQNYFASKDELVAAALDLAAPSESAFTAVADRPDDEPPITALRRTVAEASAELDDRQARQLRQVLRTIQDDPDLRAAYAQQEAGVRVLVTDLLRERAQRHGMDELSLATAVASCLTVLTVVGNRQPARPKAQEWRAQIDTALGRIERGWQS